MQSRLATFESFPLRDDRGANIMALARMGFSYNLNSKNVECSYCKYQVFNPKKDIKVITDQHLKFSTECEFNKGDNIPSVEDNLLLRDNARSLATSTSFGNLINGVHSRLFCDYAGVLNYNLIRPGSVAGCSLGFMKSVKKINTRITNRAVNRLRDQYISTNLSIGNKQSQEVQKIRANTHDEENISREGELRTSEVEARLDTPLLQALIAQGFLREYLRSALYSFMQNGEIFQSAEELIQITLSKVEDGFLGERLLNQAYPSVQVGLSACKSGYTPIEGEINLGYFNNPLATISHDGQLNLRLRNCRRPYDMPHTGPGINMKGDGAAFGSSLFQRRSFATVERAELNLRETVAVRHNRPGPVHYSHEVDLELNERYRDIEIVSALIVLLYIFTTGLHDIRE